MSTTTTRGVAQPAPAKASKARPRRGLRGNPTLSFWLFTGPFLIGLVFFLPTAVPYVAAALIWKMSIFTGVRFGLANTVLGWFGVDNVAYLSNPSPPWYWLVIVTLRLWIQSGFYMILFLAALQNIPSE